MTRANARELAVHIIYGQSFTGVEPETALETLFAPGYYETLAQECPVYEERPDQAQMAYIQRVVAGVYAYQEELRQQIQTLSIGWDVSRISRVTRAILMLAMYEAAYVEDVPKNAAISEAVRLAKLYDGKDTGAFVNGILGTWDRSREEPK